MKTSKPRSFITAAALLLCGALDAQDKPAPNAAGVIKRPGEPVCCQVTEGDREMAEAVRGARKTMDKFIATLRSPQGGQGRFAIKKPFIEGDKVEHLWVNELSFDGKVFRGRIDNAPVDLKHVHLGDKVTVSTQELSDWMFVQNDRLVGGYTIHAMCRHLSAAEKKQFEADAHCRLN